VSKVSGQARKQVLKIGAAPIPCNEPMNRRGVPQIVQAWLSSRSARTMHLSNLAQQAECSLDRELLDALAVAHPKE